MILAYEHDFPKKKVNWNTSGILGTWIAETKNLIAWRKEDKKSVIFTSQDLSDESDVAGESPDLVEWCDDGDVDKLVLVHLCPEVLVVSQVLGAEVVLQLLPQPHLELVQLHISPRYGHNQV